MAARLPVSVGANHRDNLRVEARKKRRFAVVVGWQGVVGGRGGALPGRGTEIHPSHVMHGNSPFYGHHTRYQ